MTDFAVLDFETTGLFAARYDRVIEVGIVRLDESGRLVAEYETLVDPGRDLGPTHIHGIVGADLVGAPRFDQIVGDVLELIDGAVLVSHNARFDRDFLFAELNRCGQPIPRAEPLCTMELVYAVEPGAPRRLADCCRHLGLPSGGAHRALDDARMAASLLVYSLRRWRYPALPEPAFTPARPAPSGLRKRRGDNPPIAATQGAYLASLVGRLPSGAPFLSQAAEASEYLNIVDRVVEDRRLTEAEAELLVDAASEFGLGLPEVDLLHTEYVRALVAQALEDGIITSAERNDLVAVAALLNVGNWWQLAGLTEAPFAPPDPAQIVSSRSPGAPPPPAPPSAHSAAIRSQAGLARRAQEVARERRDEESAASKEALEVAARSILLSFLSATPSRREQALPAGTTVCFTGAMNHYSRDDIEQLAMRHGLLVRTNVSKKLDVLVIADPESQSGKARKAREYGTRLLSEEAFLNLLGVR